MHEEAESILSRIKNQAEEDAISTAIGHPRSCDAHKWRVHQTEHDFFE